MILRVSVTVLRSGEAQDRKRKRKRKGRKKRMGRGRKREERGASRKTDLFNPGLELGK